MTRRTIVELIGQANASLPDNNAGEITPADVRNMILDFLDTITPMYGGLTSVSRSINLTTTPQAITFDAVLASYPPEWVATPAAGTVARSLGALPAVTSRFTIGGFCEGPQGAEIRMQLYRNGTPLSWVAEETMEGPTKSVGFNLVAIDYATEDSEYTLMASVPSGTSTMTLRDMMFVGENVPVREVQPGARIG